MDLADKSLGKQIDSLLNEVTIELFRASDWREYVE